MLIWFLGKNSFPTVPDIQIKYKVGNILVLFITNKSHEDTKRNNVFTQLTIFHV